MRHNKTLDAAREAHNKDKQIAVCLSASSDLAFAIAVTILNFVKIHGAAGFHFQIFSDAKLEKLVSIFASQGIDVSVEIYRPPVNWVTLWSSKAIAYFSPLVLAKFEGFRLLEHFRTVIWLDYDVVLRGSLAELWTRTSFDLAYLGSSQPISNGFIVPPLGMDTSREGFHAATIVFRKSFPGFERATSELYKLFAENALNLYYPEQAIFDLFLAAHPGFIRWELDASYGQYPGNELPDTKIVHAYGVKKFWNGLNHPVWTNLYESWLLLGGAPWRPRGSGLAKAIRALRYAVASGLRTLRRKSIR